MALNSSSYSNRNYSNDSRFFPNIARRLFFYFLISATLLPLPAKGWSDPGIAAITIPSADVTLSFIQPGLIAKVHIKEGDTVKANQVLIQQDDAAEQVQLSLLKKQSEDTTQIETQKASLAQKRVYLEKLQWAAERGSATELEIEEAELSVRIAELSLRGATLEHEQNRRKYREEKIRVDNMSLKSPITGLVEKVEVEVGESINGLADVIRVVRTDPLWIDVHMPLETGRDLKIDQTAQVIFPGSEQIASEGKIIFISTVADAASSTLKARIEVPNKSNRPAGEHVSVAFSAPGEEVASTKWEK